jgi:sulfhydrogenase subunit alpha
MTHKNVNFRVPTLARVEGEGALHVTVEGDDITDLRLEIYEPPRFFESFLRGRGFGEPVDITARICGICPVAYQMSAANALEQIAGVEVGGVLRDLRRLIHHRAPDREAVAALAEPLAWARDAAVEMVEWVAAFDFPEVLVDHELVSLRHSHEYPLLGGRIVSDRGLDIDVDEFDGAFVEHHVPHSTALHARRRGSQSTYLTGPLARWANNRDRVPADVDALARHLGIPDVERNPFRSIVIRSLEVLIAIDQAQEVVDAYVEPEMACVPVAPTAGVGWGVTEAPRGILVHRYETDAGGTITDVRIIPPTSQNQAAIESDVRRVVEQHLRLHPTSSETTDHDLQHRCETAVRNHDPCISCAAHFLTLDIRDDERTGDGEVPA